MLFHFFNFLQVSPMVTPPHLLPSSPPPPPPSTPLVPVPAPSHRWSNSRNSIRNNSRDYNWDKSRGNSWQNTVGICGSHTLWTVKVERGSSTTLTPGFLYSNTCQISETIRTSMSSIMLITDMPEEDRILNSQILLVITVENPEAEFMTAWHLVQ
jgi:hypothetical protein